MIEFDNWDTLIVIDGLIYGNPYHQIVESCFKWTQKSTATKRRLALVCSMAAMYKMDARSSDKMKIKKFLVPSWDDKDYEAALQYPAFLNQVKSNLDAHLIDDAVSLQDMIKSKFHFAGGSARLMFKVVKNPWVPMDYKLTLPITDP